MPAEPEQITICWYVSRDDGVGGWGGGKRAHVRASGYSSCVHFGISLLRSRALALNSDCLLNCIQIMRSGVSRQHWASSSPSAQMLLRPESKKKRISRFALTDGASACFSSVLFLGVLRVAPCICRVASCIFRGQRMLSTSVTDGEVDHGKGLRRVVRHEPGAQGR